MRWLAEIASALDHAHAQGVLHRDVTPANILFDAHGRLFLCDFGLAKHAQGPSELTRAGMVIGTPLYMSPEQGAARALGPPSDQYSLGVIAYRLLAGKVPFSADSPIALLHKTLFEPPPPPSSWNPTLPPAVDDVLARVLAKSPEERYESCAAFVAALSSALDVGVGPPGPETTVTTGTVPLSSVSPPPATPVTAGRAGVSASSATTAGPTRATATTALPPRLAALPERTSVTPPPLPQTTRVGRSRWPWIALALAGVAIAGAFALRRTPQPGSDPTQTAGSGAAGSPARTTPEAAAKAPEPLPTATAEPAPTEAPLVVISEKVPTPVPTRRRLRPTETPELAAESAVRSVAETTESPSASAPEPRSSGSRPPSTSRGPSLPPADRTYEVRKGVKINVDPTQARVFLDGRYIGISDDWDGHGGGEMLTFDAPGVHRLRFSMPGHRDATAEVRVANDAHDDTKEVEPKLEKGEPSGSTGPDGKLGHPDYATRGAVRFRVEPSDAELTVDGKSYGSVSRYADEDLALKGPMVHELELTAPGRRPKHLRVIVAPAASDEHATVKEKLKK
jgi:hypothetical protein